MLISMDNYTLTIFLETYQCNTFLYKYFFILQVYSKNKANAAIIIVVMNVYSQYS